MDHYRSIQDGETWYTTLLDIDYEMLDLRPYKISCLALMGFSQCRKSAHCLSWFLSCTIPSLYQRGRHAFFASVSQFASKSWGFKWFDCRNLTRPRFKRCSKSCCWIGRRRYQLTKLIAEKLFGLQSPSRRYTFLDERIRQR